jgi:hypothetical protein
LRASYAYRNDNAKKHRSNAKMAVHIELTEEEWGGFVSWLRAGSEYADLLSRTIKDKGTLSPDVRIRICRNCGATERYPDGRCAPCSRRRNNAIQQRERDAAKAAKENAQ